MCEIKSFVHFPKIFFRYFVVKLKLIYPNIPFWRAEISRLSLFIAEIEFEDFRPSKEEIKKMKKDGTFPFGQFPVLQVDGKTIAQTGAIARFCGKLGNLYPENIFDAAKVDEIIDLATDITNHIIPALREKDRLLRNQMRKRLVDIVLPKWLGFLEKLLIENGKKEFFVGNSVTIADLAAWRLCGWISGGIINGIPENILENFHHLRMHQNKINNLPKIKEWRKNKDAMLNT